MKENMLEKIVQLQSELNKAVTGLSPEDYKNMSVDDRLVWIRKNCQASMSELTEVLDAAGFKWWKTKPIDEDHLREELIDLLHFNIQMCIIMDMDAEAIFNKYTHKNKVNHNREDWDDLAKDNMAT